MAPNRSSTLPPHIPEAHKDSPTLVLVSHSLSKLTHRKTHRVRGPRPYSWISSSADPSLNEYWPWNIRSSSLSRTSTQRCSSPDSSISSSSSHPVHTAESSVAYDETRDYRRGRRRKPAGPREPRDNAYFDVQRVGLVVNTSPSVIPRFQREDSPIIWGLDSTDMRKSSQMPTLAHSPSSFPLDWDAIFELLGCSETDGEEVI